SEDRETAIHVSPAQYLDVNTARSPRVHRRARRLVEIDRVRAGKRPAIVLDDVSLAGLLDAKGGADRPARPVARRAVHRARLQRIAARVAIAVLAMVAFGMRVRGGADVLELRAGERALVFWKWSRSATGGKKTQRERKHADGWSLHARGA